MVPTQFWGTQCFKKRVDSCYLLLGCHIQIYDASVRISSYFRYFHTIAIQVRFLQNNKNCLSVALPHIIHLHSSRFSLFCYEPSSIQLSDCVKIADSSSGSLFYTSFCHLYCHFCVDIFQVHQLEISNQACQRRKLI